MTSTVPNAYAQLLSLGFIWTSFHCAGMCGPLLVGLDVAGAGRGVPAGRGALAILTYQAGRALTYALLGALAGLAGHGVEATFAEAGSVVALLFAVGILVVVLGASRRSKSPQRTTTTLERRARAEPPGRFERLRGGLSARLLPLAGATRSTDHLALGALMAFLPCMMPVWVLGLAATTGSPLHGAALMVLLVAMTTPTLLGVTLLPRLVLGRLGSWTAYVPRALLTLSAAWLLLVGLAGLQVIGHASTGLELFGARFMIMFW